VQRRVVAFGAFVPKQQRARIRNKKALQRTAPQRTEQRSAVQCAEPEAKRTASARREHSCLEGVACACACACAATVKLAAAVAWGPEACSPSPPRIPSDF
jgi:hypothetical protein